MAVDFVLRLSYTIFQQYFKYMNHGIIIFLLFFVFVNYNPYIEEAKKEAKGGSQKEVVSAQTWLDHSFKAADCSFETSFDSAPFQRLGFPETARRRDGDGQGALEMCLVQKIEQTDGDALWSLLYSMESMHRHTLQTWTKEPTIGAGKISFEKEMAEGRLDRLGIFATSASANPGLCSAFTAEKTQDTQKEEDRSELWGSCFGTTMATSKFSSKSSANDNSCYGESRDVLADGTGTSPRDIRQAHFRRGADCDRKSKEAYRATTGHSQDSQTSLRQTGEKEKGSPAGMCCKSETAHFLDNICGRIHQEMERLCHRLCAKRCRFGTEGDRSSRGSPRGQDQIRYSEGGKRSTRSGHHGRIGGDLGRNGGRHSRQNGDIGRNPGKHYEDGVEPGISTCPPATRVRTGSQEAAHRCRRRWHSTCTWIGCAAESLPPPPPPPGEVASSSNRPDVMRPKRPPKRPPTKTPPVKSVPKKAKATEQIEIKGSVGRLQPRTPSPKRAVEEMARNDAVARGSAPVRAEMAKVPPATVDIVTPNTAVDIVTPVSDSARHGDAHLVVAQGSGRLSALTVHQPTPVSSQAPTPTSPAGDSLVAGEAPAPSVHHWSQAPVISPLPPTPPPAPVGGETEVCVACQGSGLLNSQVNLRLFRLIGTGQLRLGADCPSRTCDPSSGRTCDPSSGRTCNPSSGSCKSYGAW